MEHKKEYGLPYLTLPHGHGQIDPLAPLELQSAPLMSSDPVSLWYRDHDPY